MIIIEENTETLRATGRLEVPSGVGAWRSLTLAVAAEQEERPEQRILIVATLAHHTPLLADLKSLGCTDVAELRCHRGALWETDDAPGVAIATADALVNIVDGFQGDWPFGLVINTFPFAFKNPRAKRSIAFKCITQFTDKVWLVRTGGSFV